MAAQQQRSGPGRVRGRVTRVGERGGAALGAGRGAGQQRASGNAPSSLRAVGGTAGRARVDAGGARLRLRALHAMGHGSARIARATGVSEQAIQKITRGQVLTVRLALRDTIAELYEAWWDKRPPERTRYERAAASAARRRARIGNWCAGVGLDDDHLDVPGYRPACGWHPARGTGSAPDICLPTPQRKAGIA